MNFDPRSYLLSLLVLAVLSSTSTAQPTASVQLDERTPLDRLGEYFVEHPELKTTPHSGWKPYQRAKWFRDRRMVNGTAPRPDARWEVWRDKMERFPTGSAGTSRSSSWFEIGPVNLCGRILDIEFHPTSAETVYVGSASGGLWKSTDGGDSWFTTTEDLPTLAIGGISISPFTPSIVLIATGEGTPNADAVGGVGILKSTDFGITWGPTSLMYPVSSGSGFHFIEVNPASGTFLAGGNDGLWRSSDAGDTWTAVLPPASYFDAKWVAGFPGTILAVGGSIFGPTEFFRSTDDGMTWVTTPSAGLPPAAFRGKTKISASPASPGTMFAHIAGEFSAGFPTLGIYATSTPAGDSWGAANTTDDIGSGQGWYNLTIAVDPDDPLRVIAGGVENWVSTDGGVSFVETGDGPFIGSETALHVDHHVLVYEPGSTSTVWAGSDGGVWKSTDDGDTWASRREGIATYQFYDICVAQSDPSVTYGGTQDNGTPVRDTGDVWFEDTLTGDGMVCNVDPLDETKVWAEVMFGVQALSTDSGVTWTGLHGYTGVGEFVTPTDLDPSDGSSLYMETSDGIFKTTDDGGSWSHLATHSASAIHVSDADPMEVWTVEAGMSPFFTTDAGGTWSPTSPYPFPVGATTSITSHPLAPGMAFVTFAGFAPPFFTNIAMTPDHGGSWFDVSGDLPPQPVNTMIVDPGIPDHWYIGTDVGVWLSTDGGFTWVPEDLGLPHVVVNDLEIRMTDRKLVAGTYGRGAWEMPLPPAVVGVEVAAPLGPIHLMLDPPRPNPVSGSAVFRFAARSEGAVTMAVYDVAGRLVTNLTEQPRGDGVIRSVSWNVEDVPSGVYFAVLKADGGRAARKVVVAR